MDKEPKKQQLSRLTPFIFLLVIIPPLLFIDTLWGNNFQHFQYFLRETISSSTSNKNNGRKNVEGNPNSLDFLLSRLVQEEDLKKFKTTGFSCDSQFHSKHCVTNRATTIDTATMTVTIPSDHPFQETLVRPYARQEDQDLLIRKVSPVKILTGNNASADPPPPCHHRHTVPAVVFSTSGFVGNTFHEVDEIVIPLFITTSHFNSAVVFVVEDYSRYFVEKYGKVLSALTSYDVVNAAANRSVHCFPAAVVGLKFHGYMSVNATDVPVGLSNPDFRQFLRRTYGLRHHHVAEVIRPRPTAALVSRTTTRRIINEDEVVAMMEDLGFRVVTIARAKIVSNLTLLSKMINSCSVLVGVHGAGLTNGLFLPDGAVVVQVDLIGLEWAAATYFGTPYPGMGVHYLKYKIDPEESSLFKIFGSRSHKAIVNPGGTFSVDVGKEVYLNGQNVNINIERFRHTMAMAMSLVQDSSLYEV